MGEWLYAAELTDLVRRKKKQVMLGGRPVALFLVGGDVFALDDVCVHKQRSLSKGSLWRGKVICPGHQWAFDPSTGKAEDHEQCQPRYDVEVRDGRIFVNSMMRAPTPVRSTC
ncbi:MAG: Rieske (2Fe-2S) protein [Sciscionella sp.]